MFVSVCVYVSLCVYLSVSVCSRSVASSTEAFKWHTSLLVR